jgi:hypothetical protein
MAAGLLAADLGGHRRAQQARIFAAIALNRARG